MPSRISQCTESSTDASASIHQGERATHRKHRTSQRPRRYFRCFQGFGPDIGIGSTEPVRQWLVRLLVLTARKSSKSICLNKFHEGPIRRLDEISTLDWKLMWHSAIWTFEAHHHSLNRLETSEIGGNTSIDSAACLWTSKHETLHSTSSALRPDHRC